MLALMLPADDHDRHRPRQRALPPTPERPRPRDRDRPRDAVADLADRMIQYQRRNAAATKPRDRSERPHPPAKRRAPSPKSPSPPPSPPPEALDHPDSESNIGDFRRRLRISQDFPSSSQQPPNNDTAAPSRHHGRLLTIPDGGIHSRRTLEVETVSEPSDHHQAQLSRSGNRPPAREALSSRQLFDPRKDDPMRFQAAVMPRPPPAPKSSGDNFVSASSSSNSSYAHSIGSSFTLTSNSTGTSGSSLSGLNAPKGDGDGNNAFVVQLKRLYREITALETRLAAINLEIDDNDDEPRFTLQSRVASGDGGQPDDKYLRIINDHKKLADDMQRLMSMTLSPQVPTSVHSISTKYNIPTRLWGNAFHRVLEYLRRQSMTSPIALEHLTDMIYWAYSFYTAIVEDPLVEVFKGAWFEALGELARYRMAIAAMDPGPLPFGPAQPLPPPSEIEDADSPSPSVGVQAAMALEVEPEREQWRRTARYWYALGLMDTPGHGRLHHHLGLLSRDVDYEDMRAVYHFVKSLTVLHTFPSSREHILPLFSAEDQRRRCQPEASTRDLFVSLHGMLFTHVQLDDFIPNVARFLERIALDSVAAPDGNQLHKQLEERDWIMMGVVTVTSLLEYGKPGSPLKGSQANVGNKKDSNDADVKSLVKRSGGLTVADEADGRDMDVDEQEQESVEDSASPPSGSEADLPLELRLAIHLAISMLRHALENPIRKPTPFARASLNPYITILLTYISVVIKQPRALAILERALPWEALVAFLNTCPLNILTTEAEGAFRLTQGCTPLPEDWCLRGMEWVGRRTFERGYWKPESGCGGEQPVLDLEEIEAAATDGIIEDDDDEDVHRNRDRNETGKRWTRVVRACASMARVVDGLRWDKDQRRWKIEGSLATKLTMWKAEDQEAARQEELRRQGRRFVSMDVDDDSEGDDIGDGTSDESGGETDEGLAFMKQRKRHLLEMLDSSHPGSRRPAKKSQCKRREAPRTSLKLVPGYTVLIVDTNILLSSLSHFAELVESRSWTIVVPLAVITELDGLSTNKSSLGESATAAVEFITRQIKTHSISLKVQTSKGNYLANLAVRSEEFHFDTDGSSWERSMDDLILRAAIWQDEHWIDRSNILGETTSIKGAAKVVLLSFDRNLRLKARARQLPVANEGELSTILGLERS